MKRPIPEADVLKAIDAVGESAVLVCGQAVAWWARYYAERGRLALESPGAMFVSLDIDFVPTCRERRFVRELVRGLAKEMRGRSDERMVFGSLVQATVTFRDSIDEDRQIEMLSGVFGVSSYEALLEQAVSQEHPTKPNFYVMHPLMLLESRIANVADLEGYQNDKARLQAKVSTWIVREWIRDRLDEGWAAAREDVERVVSLAERRRGLVALEKHGLDILASIPVEHDALPTAFREERLRRCREKLARATS